MNTNILHNNSQDFINQNLKADITKLILKGSPFDHITVQELAEQIEAKKKTLNKLPTWFTTKHIYYPNKINIEQTSSETTANYKASLINGNTLIDITGGFGVDVVAFADKFKHVIHCEINAKLSAIAQHNFEILHKQNIQTVSNDGISHLKNSNQQIDWIYIDPSRRNDTKGKVFLLKDCEPNIPEHLNTLFQFSDNILIKASPMLDITSAISELNCVKEVHVVAVQNEVKELLFILEKGYENDIQIKTINNKKEHHERFDSTLLKNTVPPQNSEPLTYLYEPNSALLKAGLFNEVSHQLNVCKLNINSHLYTSNELISFPGRRFKINNTIAYNLKQIKKALRSKQANVTTRNFPETVAQIRKKTKLKEGGNAYLFFTKDLDNEHIVLICEKI